MKHIGILGHSAEGAGLCYTTMTRCAGELVGDHQHPDITLDISAMAPALPMWEAGDYPALLNYLGKNAERLKAAGCDFWVCPDNTAHHALEAASTPFPLPGLHIANVVAEEAVRLGLKKIAITGTKWTMTGTLYPGAFDRTGVGYMAPEPAEIQYINTVIFDELCNGVFTPEAKAGFAKIIDGVVLGCTEIPLLIEPDDVSIPTLDSTRLLARAAVDVALGKRPMPTWAGGATQP